jgi:hypothetical protein
MHVLSEQKSEHSDEIHVLSVKSNSTKSMKEVVNLRYCMELIQTRDFRNLSVWMRDILSRSGGIVVHLEGILEGTFIGKHDISDSS